jgi:GAF domain-containing protein
LSVPLIRAGEAIGVIAIRRTEVRPFTDRQIDLLKTFADQAVIAIENTRLFEAEQTRSRELTERTRELTETLEYQTTTSDVLNVISRSKFELQPVLDTIVETAARLCRADMAHIRRREGDVYVHVAGYGEPPGFREYVRESKVGLGRGGIVGRVLVEKKAVQIPDVLSDSEFALSEVQRRGDFRIVLGVPLTREGVQVGIIVLLRHVVEPFTEKQIELVETFADQAVIAIENTRLFETEQASKRELTEALEQQTATSQVLEVISSSPGELEQVFHTMLENAVRICDAKFGTLFRYDQEGFQRVAGVGTPPALVEFQRQRGPFRPSGGGSLARVLRTKQVAHSMDSAAEPDPGVATTLGGARSIIAVPMLKDNELVGAIVIYRQEVRPFTEKQIQLVTHFAAQAVIAIENTRLLNELRESLQQRSTT